MRLVIFILALFLLPPAVPMAAEVAPIAVEDTYICPMHPHIHGKKGDHCPICGMELVPQASMVPPPAPTPVESKPEPQSTESAIHITPVYRQALGVRTAPVRMQEFGRSIHAIGTITPSTRHEHAISVRTAGWIAELRTDAVGDTVKKGELLFTFYSPDLLSAQADYMVGKQGGKVVGNADQRLRLYGMDEKAIAELKEKGRFLEQTPFYAPVDGTVTSLNVRKGSYVGEGDNPVLTLQDFSQVWVDVRIPLKDLQFLTAGTPATVTLDETGETFKASTDYIYPMADMESRKGQARLVLDNPDGKLKTGSIVNVVFDAESQNRLAVPAESVLYGKDGGHVFMDSGNGYFQSVPVKTGITANGLTEIISGLTEGQPVVTSGQFMIDAESSLSGGMAGMAHEAEKAENSHEH
ncbi:MAG: efflux RND transporter periplasmic adaptor subunit [Micavibrio aeruginosavorus]|nr:efflux RND transporter periplasmic adaptor subunit [Micavibrio aeruginosavorus]